MSKKFVLLFLVTMFSFSSLVFANPRPGRMADDGKSKEEMMEEMHKKHLDRLTDDLKLTDEQREKIDKLLKSGWEEMVAKKEEFRKEMKELRDQKNEKIKEVLNDDQKSKFDEICNRMEKCMRDRRRKDDKDCKKMNKKNKKCPKDKKSRKRKDHKDRGPEDMMM